MKTVEITQATGSLSDYAKRVEREPVVVLRKGKPVAVLSSARGMDAESIALANNPRFVSIIEKSRARHEIEGGISIEELRKRLGVPRGSREKRNPRR
jgi:prevent-host-death family protein